MFLMLALSLAAPVPKDKPELYFPTAVGAELTYSITLEQPVRGSGQLHVHTVTGVEDGKLGKLVTVSHTIGEQSFESHRYEVSGAGLSVVAMDKRDGRFVPIQPDVLLKLPVKPGQRWEGVNADGLKYVRTTKGIEKVKTPAGEHDAIRVDGELAAPDIRGAVGTVLVSSWYAPGVGLVRENRSCDSPPAGRGVTAAWQLTAIRKGSYGK